jgi:signal transduction histidine kinase
VVIRPVLRRLWWAPLAFVAVSLAVLLTVPLVLNARVNRLHGSLDANDHARVLLNDLESAAAAEAIASGARTGRPVAQRDSIAVEAAKHAAEDEASLDSLFRHGEPEVRTQLAQLAAIERAWRQSSTPAADRPDPIVLLAIAEHLDDRLAGAQEQGRQESRRVQKINVLLAVLLAPCALLSLGVVYWGGQRYLNVAHSLEEERAALARSLETRAALLRGITHDVKNPLGAAAGYADLLSDGIQGGALAPQQLAMVRRIRKLIGESLETIGEMLQLERGQTLDASAGRTHVDVGAIVADLVEDYRAAANEKSLAITLETANAPTVVASGATHVQHIVGNLLSNAVKYTPPHGIVRVRVARRAENHGSPDLVVVDVCDSGAGVPSELRERVFEEFYRADTAPRVATGHGVGLAISRRLARLLGGDITVGVAPEGGARFTLTLPATRRDAS